MSAVEAVLDLDGAGRVARRAAPRRHRLVLVLAALPGLAAIAVAVVGPWVAPQPLGRSITVPFEGREPGLPLGADHLGRDVWSQVLHGGRSILLVPLVATVVTSVVGGALGIVSGYARGRFDRVVSRVVDILVALPGILVLLVLVNGWGTSAAVLVAAVLLTNGPYALRYARAATLQMVTCGYVEQAVALGESRTGVICRELVPNLAGPLVAEASLRLVSAIYLVASASFLGFGPARPATDWARMINEDLSGAALNPWAVVAPAAAIVALTSSVMIVADQLARRWGR